MNTLLTLTRPWRCLIAIGCFSLLLTACADNTMDDVSGSCPCRIPTASITIDGSFDDWNDVSPVLSDPGDDASRSGAGGDLENIYLAKSGDNLYLRFEVWYDSVDASNDYNVWFDMNEDQQTDDAEDRRVSFQYSSVRVEDGSNPTNNLSVANASNAGGSNIEISLSISDLGLSERFILSAFIDDASNDTLDVSDNNVTIKNE